MEVWIAFQWPGADPSEDADTEPWEVAGIFSSEEQARAACTEEGDGYMGPFTVDGPRLARETFYLPTAYWPDFETLRPDEA